jgi:hypothetical protein
MKPGPLTLCTIVETVVHVGALGAAYIAATARAEASMAAERIACVSFSGKVICEQTAL